MLYLPAGWFHEVTSFSCEGNLEDVTENAHMGRSPFHMALNYWFYPPDVPEGSFEKPYQGSHWPRIWKQCFESEGQTTDE
eukprot:scaffold910_cov396-Prasinococcus_capsulatus_cf.AAC.55